MASSSDITSMALFCDFENVALGVRDTHHEKFDIKLVLEKLLLKGSIVVKKAYCDWERYKGFKATMHEANFELIEIPHVRQSGKNSADIRLVVDALDLCYTKAHVNTFVIISGDSDFSPLVSKLRENNKQVIGVGVKQSTSDLLTANCDEFIFYDDLVRESGRQSSRREARPAVQNRRHEAPAANPEEQHRREESEGRRTKAVDLAVQTFEALYSERGDGGKIWASVLKEAIKRRKPDFSESYYGFRSFGGLLEEAQARGFLEMGRDEKSNAYVFRSSSIGANHHGAHAASHDLLPTAALVAPTPAAPEVLPVVHRAGESEPRERGRGPRARGGRRSSPDRHDFEPTLSVDASIQQPAAPFVPADDDGDADDAAERFADAARESQASRGERRGRDDIRQGGRTQPAQPRQAPAEAHAQDDTDEHVGEQTTSHAEAEAEAENGSPRESSPRRGHRGGRGRSGARASGEARPNDRTGSRDEPRAPRSPARGEAAQVSAPPIAAPAPAPAASFEPTPSPAPAPAETETATPATKRARPARKTAAASAPAPEAAAPKSTDQPAARPRRARKTAAKSDEG